MKNKKLLSVGCSFTAHSGFDQNIHKHWLPQFAKKYNFELTNLGLPGCSNAEIFFRTVEAISTCADYDFVTVQWTSLHRLWVYHNDKNIDDYTMVNATGIGGLHSGSDHVKIYQKLHHGYFGNEYVALKQWLLYTIALEVFLKSRNLKFVFIRGTENYLDTIPKISYNKNTGFENSVLKPAQTDTIGKDDTTTYFDDMFDTKNNTDVLVLEKLSDIQNLIKQSQCLTWLNFDSKPFTKIGPVDDRADDNSHPGPIANKNLFNQLTDYYAKLDNNS